MALVPQVFDWDYAELAPDVRKTFEVALHAGSAPALFVALRRRGLGQLRHLGLTLLPPALVGGLFEDAVERRLGSIAWVRNAQVAAGMALLLADLAPERRDSPDAHDHVAVGLAQAAALAPGVSRAGAALTAARCRGLSRSASLLLSLRAAVPVTLAAGALKAFRTARKPLAPELRAPLAVGWAAALISGLASLPLLRLLERPAPLRALAGYRIVLGATLAPRPNRT
jgi:undecaprenyl-diphosphatase